VILAISETCTSELRDLSKSLGVDVAPLGNVVIDHFNFHPRLDGSQHTVITSESLAELPAVFSSGSKGPVVFKGVPLSVSRESEVAFHAITGSDTAYSGVAGKAISPSKSPLAGKSLGLLTLVQGRNNARVAVSGSTDMLSNKYYSAAPGNAEIATDVLRWTLRQKSVLRASSLRHRMVETNEISPAIYRINDVVEVAVDIQECTDSVCKPFQGTDVQIEFVMLDPHVRTTLVSGTKNGTFSAVVKVPDTYGVFKWVLEYKRLGYSWVSEVVTVPVRPFRHYEYERFIVQAYPYYASVGSMMAGFFALGFFFLYSKESSK
jgi:oligosaccharyltransferase complex subunit beta